MLASVTDQIGLAKQLALVVPVLSTTKVYVDVTFKLTINNELSTQLLTNAKRYNANQITNPAILKLNGYAARSGKDLDYKIACARPDYNYEQFKISQSDCLMVEDTQ